MRLFADAPNPRFCPHHNCGTDLRTAGGWVVVVIVVLIVIALLASLGIWQIRRRRRRRMLAEHPP